MATEKTSYRGEHIQALAKEDGSAKAGSQYKATRGDVVFKENELPALQMFHLRPKGCPVGHPQPKRGKYTKYIAS